jgi:hypothetical protein
MSQIRPMQHIRPFGIGIGIGIESVGDLLEFDTDSDTDRDRHDSTVTTQPSRLIGLRRSLASHDLTGDQL